MIRKYSNLLPAYLDGTNIRKHANIIEREDEIIENRMNLLREWNNIERPIIIKREQKQTGQSSNGTEYTTKITIYVHTANPIRQISVTSDFIAEEGDLNDVINYMEEEIQTNVTLEYNLVTISEASGEYHQFDLYENQSVLPDFTVTVQTYNDLEYVKSYPENDNRADNSYDHDEFLDIIGNLLGLPRRTYKEFQAFNFGGVTLINNYGNTTPHYFAKQVNISEEEGTITGTALPCTEDDYYYRERLIYLIENKNKDLCKLYLQLIYETPLTIIQDYTRYGVPKGSFLYLLRKDAVAPVNIDSPPINMALSSDPYLARFIPVTREAYVVPNIIIYWLDIPNVYSDGVARIRVLDPDENPVPNITFETLDPLQPLVTSDENGDFLLYPTTSETQEEYPSIREIYPVTEDVEPELEDDYSCPHAEPDMDFRDTFRAWINYGETPISQDSQTLSICPGCLAISKAVHMARTHNYYTTFTQIFPGESGGTEEGFILQVDEETRYNVPLQIDGKQLTGLYTTPTHVYALHDNSIIATYEFTEDYKLGVYCNTTSSTAWAFYGVQSYLSTNSPASSVVEYGLGTDNPWTSTLTNAIIDSNGIAWTNYTRTPALYSGIPLTGDFEVTLLLGNDATGGAGSFGLSNISGTEVLMANINNTVNNVSVNTIFPCTNTDETITMKREGTTYTYVHGSEIKTFTINNTDTLYLKVNKSGNGSLYLKTMTVTGGQ